MWSGGCVAFKTERPREIRDVEVPVAGGRKHRGANLDDVLRQILWDLAEREGWSENKAASNLGVPQATLHDFMAGAKDGKSLKLQSVSRICAALKTSPVDLFRLHERYRPEARDEATFAEDLVFDRFRALLSHQSARRLVRLIEIWNDRGSLPSQLDAWEKSHSSASPSKASGSKKKGRAPQ
jgi:DNA-binding Xre family transcriptional regulator